MPVGNILVSHTGRHVKHDDGTLSLKIGLVEFRIVGAANTHLNVITVPQSSELLLAGSVPHVEPDGSSVGVEHKRVDLKHWKSSLAFSD